VIPYSGYTVGLTPDGRIKPDLGTPTFIMTAGNHDDMHKQSFSGTSCSTPFAGGIALLLKMWMESGGDPVEPGHVHAMMYMCGTEGAVSATEGVGLLALPDGGMVWWGEIPIEEGTSETIPLDPEGMAVSGIQAACWWPEYDMSDGGFPSVLKRARITLKVSDDTGAATATSDVNGSVFQLATARRTGAATAGTWKLRLEAPTAPALPGHEDEEGAKSRVVYWAAWLKP
jgi:hypothetical protein